MTTVLFRSWLEHFNAAIRAEARRVLLLLDNAPPHRVTETFSNDTLHYLPPNQPLIFSLKTPASSRLSRVSSTRSETSTLSTHWTTSSRAASRCVDKIYEVAVLAAMH